MDRGECERLMSQRILITGAGGFLGSHICHYFGSRGHSIAAVGRFAATPASSLLYPNLWKLGGMTLPDKAFIALIKEFNPTLLIHCAGTACVADSVQEPYSDFQRTAEVCAFSLEVVRKHAPKCRIILLSSAAVYGNPARLPIFEESPVQPISPYGYHKRICEMLAEEYACIYDLDIAIIRIFSAYGERLQKQVIFDLCRKFSSSTSDKVEIYGTGLETRDFIHARDVAQVIECIVSKSATGLFNVASGVQSSIRDITHLIKENMGSSKEVTYTGNNRAGDPLCWQADIGRIERLGFSQQVSLEVGIRDYCHWFRQTFSAKQESQG
jgi:UDP-glucose 4-epimerase